MTDIGELKAILAGHTDTQKQQFLRVEGVLTDHAKHLSSIVSTVAGFQVHCEESRLVCFKNWEPRLRKLELNGAARTGREDRKRTHGRPGDAAPSFHGRKGFLATMDTKDRVLFLLIGAIFSKSILEVFGMLLK